MLFLPCIHEYTRAYLPVDSLLISIFIIDRLIVSILVNDEPIVRPKRIVESEFFLFALTVDATCVGPLHLHAQLSS
jgi:hypothetical protein